MQRLFATFPDGQPGAALLILRLSVGGILAFHGTAYWQDLPALWVTMFCSGIGILLAIGLFTPFTTMLGAAVGVVALFFCKGGDPVAGSFVLAVMAALGLLGAGAYSLDARLYGRREVVVPSRHDP